MRFFLISLFFTFFISCGSITKNYTLQERNLIEVKNNYFSDSSKDYIYKAKIDVYGNYIGGIVAIKRLAKNHHRIVFTTEFGAKMLDIEIKEGELIKNKVVDKLNRKIILNTLKKDFEILLHENATILNVYTSNGETIYQTKKDNRFNLYFFDNEKLVKITNTTKHKEKVEFLFSNIKNNEPKDIKIDHKNIKLNIDLKYLK